MSDGKEAKFIFLDDLSQPKSENNTVVDLEKLKGIVKQWYEHNIGRSIFTVLGGTVMSKGDFEEKMLLNKCFICGGFLYQHTDLETASQYIYCPKCKEERDKVKEKMLHDLIKADMV